VANLRRTADGKPDLNGFYEFTARGANQGLERRARGGPGGGGQSLIVDPPNGTLPMQPWAVEEKISRNLTERGYDDATAHCFPPGVPRAMWIPEGYQIVQTPDYIVFLYERVAWRIIPLLSGRNADRPHLPDNVRLWDGDSLWRWEGDTLVIDTANLNGKTWLNEGGEIVSYAERVVERITPTGPDTFNYEATVTDPVVYTRPWTVVFPIRREIRTSGGCLSRGGSRPSAPESSQRCCGREERLAENPDKLNIQLSIKKGETDEAWKNRHFGITLCPWSLGAVHCRSLGR
jgi:hypothetical protein